MKAPYPVQLYAVEESGLRPLPVASHVTGFDELYDNLSLGVYSALRTFEHNKFLYLADHISRTEKSMRLLGWDYVWDKRRFCDALHEAVSAYPGANCRVRFDILADSPAHLHTTSRELIALINFPGIPSTMYTDGVRCDYAAELKREAPLIKTAVFAQTRHTYQSTHQTDVYEHLMVDGNGYVLEGTGTNFYAVRDGVIYTAGEGVLEGITRKIILQLADDLGIPVRLTAVHRDEIAQCSETAVSSSSRGWLPVVQIGSQIVGNGRPGAISQQMIPAYNAFVTRTIQTAVQNIDQLLSGA